MSRFAKELIESMMQAAAYAQKRRARGVRLSKVTLPDVKAIRRSLRMSQHCFRRRLHSAADTQDWEQGRRHPDAPAAAYLRAIKRRPKEIMEAIGG